MRSHATPRLSRAIARPPAASREQALRGLFILTLALLLGLILAGQARAQGPAPLAGSPSETWPVLAPSFESTGGGGIVISEYRPMVVGDRCVTDFVATEPSGLKHYNVIEFEAVPLDGGHLCRNGKWRAVNGSASGTTPLRAFIRDGVVYRAPDGE